MKKKQKAKKQKIKKNEESYNIFLTPFRVLVNKTHVY